CRIFPEIVASTLCPLVSSTRNIALGSASDTVPSISMTPSFLAIASLTLVQTGRSAVDGDRCDDTPITAQRTKDQSYGIPDAPATSRPCAPATRTASA